MAATPTQRSLKHLRDRGYIAGKVEQRVPHTFTTRDLFGFADLVAVSPSPPRVAFVQVTSGSNVSARLRKLAGIPAVAICKAAGCVVAVHGWRKLGKRGARKTWQLREVIL